MDIFAKIAAGEIPSYKVAENEEFYAFLDINPLVKGHTLVIPRREVDYFFDTGSLSEVCKASSHCHQEGISLQEGRSGGTGSGGSSCTHPPYSYAE